MSGYVNTRLIDCNRLNSEEHRQDELDKSKWTSKVGSGVKLNPGDKVSIHASFISELGCGNADVIETNGNILGEKVFNYTNFSYNQPEIPLEDTVNNANFLPNNRLSRYAENIDDTIKVSDNELNIVISYYKNANGEQHIHLPRRFDREEPTRNGDTGPNEWYRANEFRSEDSFDKGRVYKIPDFENRVYKDWLYTREPTYGIRPQKEGEPANNSTDGYIIDGGDKTIYSVEGPKDGSSIGGVGQGKEFVRMTDNSRYVIYVQKYSVWDQLSSDIDTHFVADNDTTSIGERDPALIDYIKYKELKSYKINDGFNSPANIGTQLTAELSNVRETKNKYFIVNPNITAANGGPGLDIPEISLTIESDTYKLIDAANWFTLRENNYQKFFDVTDEPYLEQSVWYYSAYSMIGVKRPELFDSIRNFYPTLNETFDVYDKEDYYTLYAHSIITDGVVGDKVFRVDKVLNPANPERYIFGKDILLYTNIPWNQTSLNAITKIFNSQALYPELFDYKSNSDVNINNSRFIHMDTISDTDIALGYDGYEQYDNGTTDIYGLPSAVIFIKYDVDKKDNLNINQGTLNNLYGGFGYKYYNTEVGYDCIAFSTDDIRFTNISIFPDESDETSFLTNQRKIGFDLHFNSYGCACLLPYTGIMETDVDNRTFNTLYQTDGPKYKLGESPDFDGRTTQAGIDGSIMLGENKNMIDFSWSLRHIYCGAIDPLIKFDSDTSRFQISQLHTPEKYGNQFMAGAGAEKIKSGWQGTLTPSEDNGTIATSNVYKINKHVEPFLYTPDIAPYFTEKSLPNVKSGMLSGSTGVETVNNGYFSHPTDTGFNAPYGETAPDKNFRYINTSIEYILTNTKIKMWEIFDSQCGISIEDFGVEKEWSDDSLLGILGYTDTQLLSTNKTGNYQTRLTKDTMNNINPVTTNAIITSLDAQLLNKNIWGTNLPNNPSIPYQTMSNIYLGYRTDLSSAEYADKWWGTMNFNVARSMLCNEIINTQESAVFTANRLPRKMTIPYYLVCSSLIDDKFYNGNKDGNTAPIMGVVNRENGFGDYYFGGETSNTFTITAPTTITEITTQILDPKMKPARLDEDSCIIYKVEKQMNNNLDVMATLPKNIQMKILEPPGL
jgi:hypothetical protein